LASQWEAGFPFHKWLIEETNVQRHVP
jgi:hypothetical protein